MIAPCRDTRVKMSQTGCALHILNVANFVNLNDNCLAVNITVTEEGTELSIVKSKIIALTYQIGKVEFVDLPKHFERERVIEGFVKVSTFSGAPISNKKVYLSEGELWPLRVLLILTTDRNGLARFLIAPPEHPTTEIQLRASVDPEQKYHEYKTLFFTSADTRIHLLQPATPYSPVFSELTIESSEETFKCGAEVPITINYYIVGETTEIYSINLIYMVWDWLLLFSSLYFSHSSWSSLPYSIIRGEVLELKATVFNYLSKCIMVKVTPMASSDYIIEALSPGNSSCLCANGRKTFKWTLIPTVLAGHLHWSQSASDGSSVLSVEISSYMLLAVLTTGELTAADLGYANRIVRWLVKKQNPYGGFSSTQDTVVVLQALALYSTKVFSSDGSSTVTVTSADGDSHNFDVNQNNKLVYQERSLQDVPGKYSIDVRGSSCVSVQTALFYNVTTPFETSTLSITTSTGGSYRKLLGKNLLLKFKVVTNMIIVDIKLLSGFTADPGELKKGTLVERVDSKDDHLVMYIKALQRNTPITYCLNMKQVLPVKNLKSAVIKIYDYYQTSDHFETEYTGLNDYSLHSQLSEHMLTCSATA
ncbi:hypothetical protein HF521_002928 [Silurus meridionalis]|uniref:Alpha-macroglobulin receptor-binding domain-containing protein n=1 Tax=Silurus meridionalis TaxID=175797 RepID=A0A8T0B1H7_SILME|nr:hypothetical protein HF521_002928 [Silurus meridionalis]